MSTRVLLPVLLLTAVAVAGCGGDPPNIKLTQEPAGELMAATLDSEWLDRLVAWTRDAAQERLDGSYAANGVPPEGRTATARVEGRFIDVAGERLALIDLAYSGSPVRVTRVVGLRDGLRVTVSCTAPDGRPFDVTDPSDDCGRKVAEVFAD